MTFFCAKPLILFRTTSIPYLSISLGCTLSLSCSYLTSLVTRIQLEYRFAIRISKQLPGKAENRCCLADAWHTGDDKMRHIAISGDDLEPLNRLRVADDIVQDVWPVFFDPMWQYLVIMRYVRQRLCDVVRITANCYLPRKIIIARLNSAGIGSYAVACSF